MPIATPRTDVLETLDIEGDLSREFALGEFFLDTTAESRLVGFIHLISLHIQADAEFIQNALAERTSDALDRREGDLDALIAGEDDAGDTEHKWIVGATRWVAR